MAEMAFREPDMLKWVGVRPGHNGTQVIVSKSKTNGTEIVHTVSTGKTLYLCAVVGNAYASAATATVQIYIRDDSDVLVCKIMRLFNVGAGHAENSIAFDPPLEIPAGYDVVVDSNSASHTGHCFIFGWEA